MEDVDVVVTTMVVVEDVATIQVEAVVHHTSFKVLPRLHNSKDKRGRKVCDEWNKAENDIPGRIVSTNTGRWIDGRTEMEMLLADATHIEIQNKLQLGESSRSWKGIQVAKRFAIGNG